MADLPLPGTGRASLAVPAPGSGPGTTAYATSADGLAWQWHGTALAPRPGGRDARGARVTAVLADGRAFCGHRLYYEAPLPDGSHEVRTELISSGD